MKNDSNIPQDNTIIGSAAGQAGQAGQGSSSGGRPPGGTADFVMADDAGDERSQNLSNRQKSTVDAVGETLIGPDAVQPEGSARADDQAPAASSQAAPQAESPAGSKRPSQKETDNQAAEVTATYIPGNAPSPAKQSAPKNEIGPYEIIGELGRGGMGVVFKARHKQLRREVALKMVLGTVMTEKVKSRFHLEAQSVAALKHPGIVQIYEFGEHGGDPWFALELVDGKNLAELSGKQPMEPERAARLVADLAAAVAFAHDRGVLHRDIKPANVLVTTSDVPKLSDFGLAKRVATDDLTMESFEHKTIDGQIIGTPSYMPPEQARADSSLIGPAADQYSLGATLYHLLTGRAPFVGSKGLEVVMQVIQNDPLSVRQLRPAVPLDLETICSKSMSKDPSRRYPNCAELEADLRRYLRHEPIVARPIGNVERFIRWCRRNPRIALPSAAAVCATLAALGIFVWSTASLTNKNKELATERDNVVKAKNLADTNAGLARNRAIKSNDAVGEMLMVIRTTIPSNEDKFRPVRQKLSLVCSQLLDGLPDIPGDAELNTGHKKALILQEQYLIAMEAGEYTKALEYLKAAEDIVRARNAAQGTDQTRKNLYAILFHQARARATAKRDMAAVLQYHEEAHSLLTSILAKPHPHPFDADHGSVNPLEIRLELIEHGYKYALTLKKLGQVKKGLEVINEAVAQFDVVMDFLRGQPGPVKDMPKEQWEALKRMNRGGMSNQDQLRALLLASSGRSAQSAKLTADTLELVKLFIDADQTPAKVKSRLNYSLDLIFNGDLARQRGDRDGALKAYEASTAIAKEFYDAAPTIDDWRGRYAVGLTRMAALLQESDPERAKKLAVQAFQLAQLMVNADPAAIGSQVTLALASPLGDSPANAVALAEKILKSISSLDAEMAIDLARVFSAAAAVGGRSEKPNQELCKAWKERALKLLAGAAERGYRDAIYIQGEPDFDAIRDEPEYKELLVKFTPTSPAEKAAPSAPKAK